jgi:hypothetical protein
MKIVLACKPLSPAAQRALAEAAVRRAERDRAAAQRPPESGRRSGELDPVRYGDWEVKGIATDYGARRGGHRRSAARTSPNASPLGPALPRSKPRSSAFAVHRGRAPSLRSSPSKLRSPLRLQEQAPSCVDWIIKKMETMAESARRVGSLSPSLA